jgi:hypothetical protein
MLLELGDPAQALEAFTDLERGGIAVFTGAAQNGRFETVQIPG